MADDLLPPNATAGERALAGVSARIDAIPVPIDTLWDPDLCPVPVLPFLAWTLSVDYWRPDWPEATQRDAIRGSIERHRTKGSIGSIRRALAEMGHPGAIIHEGVPPAIYDGATLYDGSRVYAAAGSWAQYRVELPDGLTDATWAALEANLLTVAPVRCHLVSMTVPADIAAPIYDATHAYDGAIAYQ